MSHRAYLGITEQNKIFSGVGSAYSDSKESGLRSDEWAHLALLYDANSDKYSVYINGDSKFTSPSLYVGTSRNAVVIGAVRMLSEIIDHIDGSIDDFQVWDQALSTDQIINHMVNPPTGSEADLIAYYDFTQSLGDWVQNLVTGDFDVKLSHSDLLQIEDDTIDTDGDGLNDTLETAMCTDLNSNDTDSDGLEDAIEIGVGTGVLLSDPCKSDTDHDGMDDLWEYENNANAKVPDTGSLNAISNTSNWVAYYEAMAAIDQTNSISPITSENVIDLSSKNEFVHTSLVPQESSSYSFLAWVKFDSLSGQKQRMGVLAGSRGRFAYGLDESGDLYVGGGNRYASNVDAPFNVGEWVHFGLVKQEDGSLDDYYLYVNGQLYSSFRAAFSSDNQLNMILGAVHSESGISDFMEAQVDDVQLWTTALDVYQVQSYMITPPVGNESSLVALYDFSTTRGQWVENKVTGNFDAKMSSNQILSQSTSSLDSDGDGLTDIQETALCSDLLNADTDGDGLSDGLEMGADTGITIGDPCQKDSDSDGIDDFWEYQHGSSLLNSDVGGDANADGVSNWAQFQQDKEAEDLVAGIEVTSADRFMDLRGMNGALYTPVIPGEAKSFTLMSWVKLGRDDLLQRFGIDGSDDNKMYLGLDDQSNLLLGAGNFARTRSQTAIDADTWTHLALVKEESGEYDDFKVFVNGINIATASGIFNSQNAINMVFGAVNSDSGLLDYMDAAFDDVQVWEEALSETEILSYMITQPASSEVALLAYYDFTNTRGSWVQNLVTGDYDAYVTIPNLFASSEPLIDSDGDGIVDRHELALCTHKDNQDTDNDGLSDGLELGVQTGQVIGDPCSLDSDHDGIEDAWEYSTGSQLLVADVSHDTDGDGLVNWLNYAQDKQAEDVANGVVQTSGERMLDLRGNAGFAYTQFVPKIEESMTLMGWFNFETTLGSSQIMGADSNSHALSFGLNSDSDLHFAGGSRYQAYYKAPITPNEWVHIALIREELGLIDTYTVYVNGQKFKDFVTVVETGGELNLVLGALNDDSGIVDHMNAAIDDIQVWSKPLTQSEVQNLMLNAPMAMRPI